MFLAKLVPSFMKANVFQAVLQVIMEILNQINALNVKSTAKNVLDLILIIAKAVTLLSSYLHLHA